jgi:hypothetical protein
MAALVACSGHDPDPGSILPEAETFECGQRLSSGFILGGEDAKRGEFPFVAALGYKTEGNLHRVFFFTK